MAAKKVPFNLEVEQAILGLVVVSSAAQNEVFGILTPSDFYDKKNKVVFAAILKLIEDKSPVTAATITTELSNSKQLEEAGGTEYLLELIDNAIDFPNLKYYIGILKDTTSLRDLLSTMQGIIDDYNKKKIEDVSVFINGAAEQISEVTNKQRVGEFIPVNEVTSKLQQELEILRKSARAGEASLTGINTGYTKLNTYLHGFQPGNLIVLAARTGVGKTAFALNLAFNAATKANRPVAIFSLEMPGTDLIKRIVSAESNISHESLTTGFFKDRDLIAINEACETISKTKIYIHDSGSINISDIMAKCRQLKAKEPDLGLIIVDHIGLVEVDNSIKSRQEAVQKVSISLKKVALELEVPVLAVAQLNREVDKSPTRVPELNNLRESGSIEQDADVVLLMWRDDYYANSTKKVGKEESAKDSVKRTIESKEVSPGISLVNINVAKNRNGRTGKLHLMFRKDYMKFDNPTEEFEEEMERAEQMPSED